MKSVAILALGIATIVSAADVRDVNRTVPLRASGSLAIETHKGSIRVSTWDRPEVEIQARIEAEPGSIMDRRRFDGTEVRFESTADSVQIKTVYADFNWCCSMDSGSNPEVRYTIRMPKTARLTIRDHRSDTEITGLQGALDFSTHSGTAHVHGLSGALLADTHRGTIDVEFAAFTAESKVTTHRGTVDLSMPKSSRFDIQSDSGRRGSVDTDFAMMTHAVGKRGESVHGTVNGGGPLLRVETYRGQIRIRAK